MGETYKISCKCGYVKELNVGGGLASINKDVINKIFSEEKLKEFDINNKNNEVQSFIVENELSLCDKCSEIITTAVLKVQLTNNRKYEIINDCPTCKNTIQIINESLMCPKCGQKLTKEKIGHWD